MASTSTSKPKASRIKLREHHARVQPEGLRPIQIWVPDVHAQTFRADAHQQSLAVSRSVHAHEDQAFIDSVSDWSDE